MNVELRSVVAPSIAVAIASGVLAGCLPFSVEPECVDASDCFTDQRCVRTGAGRECISRDRVDEVSTPSDGGQPIDGGGDTRVSLDAGDADTSSKRDGETSDTEDTDSEPVPVAVYVREEEHRLEYLDLELQPHPVHTFDAGTDILAIGPGLDLGVRPEVRLEFPVIVQEGGETSLKIVAPGKARPRDLEPGLTGPELYGMMAVADINEEGSPDVIYRGSGGKLMAADKATATGAIRGGEVVAAQTEPDQIAPNVVSVLGSVEVGGERRLYWVDSSAHLLYVTLPVDLDDEKTATVREGRKLPIDTPGFGVGQPRRLADNHRYWALVDESNNPALERVTKPGERLIHETGDAVDAPVALIERIAQEGGREERLLYVKRDLGILVHVPADPSGDPVDRATTVTDEGEAIHADPSVGVVPGAVQVE